MTIITERLTELDQFTLARGTHNSRDDGMCAEEYISYMAGERHSADPDCVSPVLKRFTVRLNDWWGDEQRQTLKPYLARQIGTRGDGQDEARVALARAEVGNLLAPWLRLAGLDDHADAVLAAQGEVQLTKALRAARDAAWDKRRESRRVREARIREILISQGVADADAAADAAVAVAAAAAAAAAAAVAAAAAAAAGAAAAVAAGAGAAAAVAAAAAAAAAADAAAAAGAGAAAAAAAAGSIDWWGKPYQSAYKAARAYYDDWYATSPQAQAIRDLSASQSGAALDLLDKMIDPSGVTA